MPIKPCKLEGGGNGWKYGDSGKCYKNRADAIKQMRAIKWQQSKGEGNQDYSGEGLSNEELLKVALADILEE